MTDTPTEDPIPEETQISFDEPVEMADDMATMELDELPEELAEVPSPSEAQTKTVYRGSGVRWGFVVGLFLAVMLVILVFQNTAAVQFQFLWFDIETPLAALLIATAVLAAVADELVGLVVRSQRRKRLAEKEELEKLREQSGP